MEEALCSVVHHAGAVFVDEVVLVVEDVVGSNHAAVLNHVGEAASEVAHPEVVEAHPVVVALVVVEDIMDPREGHWWVVMNMERRWEWDEEHREADLEVEEGQVCM